MKLSCGIAVVALSFTAVQVCSFAQTPANLGQLGCKEVHLRKAPVNPRLTEDGLIVPGQVFVQLRLALDEKTIIRVLEYPRTVDREDFWNTTIIIQSGQHQKRYPLKQIIEYGETLRVTEAATLCLPSQKQVVVLAFESPSTGASDGFCLVRYSAEFTKVEGFPPVSQGKIVIDRLTPDKAELWSASGSPDNSIECDACEKFYQVQDCRVGGAKMDCLQRAGTLGPLSPGKFMQHRIEIR